LSTVAVVKPHTVKSTQGFSNIQSEVTTCPEDWIGLSRV